VQREINHHVTISANYAGSISHFIAGASNIRGLQSGEISPAYGVLGTTTYGAGLLSKQATPTNIAAAQAILPGCCTTPYPGYAAAAAISTTATIAQSLKWMPQFSGTTDTWGIYSANASYNAVQISLAVQDYHGLTLNVNYTFDKQMDDAGTQRSGFAIPGSMTLDGKSWKANKIDRSLSTLDEPQNLAVYGVYKLPFGKSGFSGRSLLMREITGGWEFSSIMDYVSGPPLTLSLAGSACTAVGQGTCMPDVNPNFHGSPRINGKWGANATGLTYGTIPYVAGYISNATPGMGVGGVPCATSTGPFCNPGPMMIGNAPRTGAFGLRAPNNFRLNSGIHRQFDITDRVKFLFGADCYNVTNAVTFGINAANLAVATVVSTATFGEITTVSADSRAFQFSGRITF